MRTSRKRQTHYKKSRLPSEFEAIAKSQAAHKMCFQDAIKWLVPKNFTI